MDLVLTVFLNVSCKKISHSLVRLGCGATEVVRGGLRAAGKVQHELPDRDQLDGRAGLQAAQPGGVGGRQGQGGVGEARGEYQPRHDKHAKERKSVNIKDCSLFSLYCLKNV